MSEPRKASTASFPYAYPGLVCYFELRGDQLAQADGRAALRDAVKRAYRGESELYAVWPGKWKSDLFHIDDLRALAAKTDVDLNAPALSVSRVKALRKMIDGGHGTVESVAELLELDVDMLRDALEEAAT